MFWTTPQCNSTKLTLISWLFLILDLLAARRGIGSEPDDTTSSAIMIDGNYPIKIVENTNYIITKSRISRLLS